MAHVREPSVTRERTHLRTGVRVMLGWIHHLPIGRKFLVLSLVALLMVAAPTLSVINTSRGLYRALEDERAGLPPVKVLLKLLRLTQEHRGLSNAVLNGELSKAADRQARQQAIDQAFSDIDELYAKLPREALKPELRALKADWQDLSGRVAQAGIASPDSLKAHTALVNRMLNRVEDETGASGMALDADAACYHLITAAFRDLPRLSEKMGLARARGTVMLVKRSTDPDERSTLVVVVLMSCLGGMLAVAITRNTVHVMQRVVDAAEALSRGDLTQRAGSSQRDEIGQVQRAIARAVEQLRGFAVVASEVRSLAQRSAEAAREIKTLIADSVSQGIAQVNQAVTLLDQATQQNAALVEESSAAASSLRDQADRLQASVSTFRLA